MKKFVFQDEEGTFIIRSRETIVELTEEEMNVFIWFRKYQNIFEKMKKMKGGSATLHFNEKEGNIRKAEWTYQDLLSS